MQQPHAIHNPIRLGDATRAMQRLLADPDDTHQVFDIIEALSGNTGQRLLKRVKARAAGQRLVSERADILRLLADRQYLGSLPEGSLGQAYLAFLKQENITPDGLVEASATDREPLPGELGAELTWLHHRMRDTHDLWHTVTGYHGDLVGEASLLAFTFAQTRNPGIGFIVAASLLVGPMLRQDGALRFPNGDPAPRPRRLIVQGFLRGFRAAFLPGVAWEELLALPLEVVRRDLGVGPAPRYQTIRSHEVDLTARRRRFGLDAQAPQAA